MSSMVGRWSALSRHKVCRPYYGMHFLFVNNSHRVKCMQTPDHGINFGTPADVKSPIHNGESNQPLGWYRTMIETMRVQTHSWPNMSQGRTVHLPWLSCSFASRLGLPDFGIPRCLCPCHNMFSQWLDISWKVVAPFYIGFIFFMFKRCIIAVLNSNMEVSLWVAGKNHLKGEWLNVCSSFLFKNL